jgi:hypothetical protein
VPNYCHNRLRIRGAAEELQKIVVAVARRRIRTPRRPRATRRAPIATADEASSIPSKSSGLSSCSVTFVRTVAAAHDVAATTVSETGIARLIGPGAKTTPTR